MTAESQASVTLSRGRSPRTGRFNLDVASGRWDWDEEVYRIHGVASGTVDPTTDYLLQTTHPEDTELLAAALARAGETGEPFSVSYRLLAADEVQRRVVLVCEAGMCDDDAVTQIGGYFIDLTAEFDTEAETLAREAVAASAAHRATIEQAKGSLMAAYGLDPDQAFAMLSWWSRNTNVKVRDLADRIVRMSAEGKITDGDLRQAFDHLLHDASAEG